MKVLIAADNILFCEGLAGIVSSRAHFDVVGYVGTARAAVERAVGLQADLVLMDVELPDGSGLEALREIMARRPNCSVVILSGHDSDEYLFEAFRSGARGYILKSTTSAHLLKALEVLAQGQSILSRHMAQRIVQEFSRLGRDHHADVPELERLTPRELEVFRYLATGASNSEIAAHLIISENTTKVHVRNIREKLGYHSRGQLVSFARRCGVVPPRHAQADPLPRPLEAKETARLTRRPGSPAQSAVTAP